MPKFSLPRRKRDSLVFLFLGIVFFLAFILLMDVDFRKLAIAVSGVKPYFVLTAILFDVGFIFFFALAWFFLVKIVSSKVKLSDAVLMVILGWFSDMLFPAGFLTGEAVRLFLLKMEYGVEMSKTAATVVVHRLLSAIAFCLFVLLGLGFFLIGYQDPSLTIVKHALFGVALASGVVAVGLLILIRADFVEKTGMRMFEYAAKMLHGDRISRYREKVEGTLVSFRLSLDLMKKKRSNILLGFMSLMTQWFFGVMIPYIFFRAVGSDVAFWAVAIAFPIYGLVDNIPMGIPANAGILDVAMTSTFILLGVPKEIALTVTLLTRSIIVLFEALLTGTITSIYVTRYVEELSLEKIRQVIEI